MTRISDLQLASYLLARGFRLLRTEGPERRKTFVFAEVPEEVTFAYYGGQDAVSARLLFDAHRNLRGLVVQGLRAKEDETHYESRNHLSA